MIDWEEVLAADSGDDLRELKVWLFRENMRLQEERQELEASKERFLSERVKLRNELDELNRRTVIERKRLKEETLFFDKKMEILKAGFRQLDLDRQKFEQERKGFRKQEQHSDLKKDFPVSTESVELLFKNTSNPLALRKRYRDLVKIFHPDNLFGDAELMQSINQEYSKRRERM